MSMESVIEVPADLVADFVELIKQSHAAIPRSTAQQFLLHPFVKLPYFFDLDKIWADPVTLEAAVHVFEPLFRRFDDQFTFDTIAVTFSVVGSSGPLPLVSILARDLRKRLVVFKEVEFGMHLSYPRTASTAELLDGRRVMVVKDIVVRAGSLKDICSLITKSRGTVVLSFVFVEVETEIRPPLTEYLREAVATPDFAVVRVASASEIMELLT